MRLRELNESRGAPAGLRVLGVGLCLLVATMLVVWVSTDVRLQHRRRFPSHLELWTRQFMGSMGWAGSQECDWSDAPVLHLDPSLETTKREAEAAWVRHLHGDTAESSSKVYLSHISKCGGTTLCHLARANGLAVAEGHNCNAYATKLEVKKGRPWFWADWPKGEQHDWALRQPYDLIGNEKRLGDEMMDVGEPWVYITAVREPIARLESLYEQWKYGMESDRTRSAKKLPFAEWAADFHPKMRPAQQELKNAQFKSNFMVRYFCGTACYNLAPDSLNESHLAIAKDRLAKYFSVILVLEDGCFSQTAELLYRRLGWTQYDVNWHRSQTRNFGDRKPEETDFVRRWNALDAEFYLYAKSLARTFLHDEGLR